MADLGKKFGGCEPISAKKTHYPSLHVDAKPAGLAGARIGQPVRAEIRGKITSMNADSVGHTVGIEVTSLTLSRKLKEEKMRRKLHAT